jgi:hypothetical protein
MMINGDMPIPGENYTSDTKNYPWHQPPEFSNVTDALDKMSLKLTQPKIARGIMAFADAGFPLVRITQMIIMEGIAQGKWTVDMGLLLAGPFCKIIEIMCDSYEIEYTLGLDEDEDFNTGTLFKGQIELEKQSKQSQEIYNVVKQQMPEITETAMEQEGAPADGAATAEPEQDLGQEGFAQMMGGGAEEEESK